MTAVLWGLTAGHIHGAAAGEEAERPAWPSHTLRAERVLALEAPARERFDASALLQRPTGELLTVRDQGPTLYRIQMEEGASAARLLPFTHCFSAPQLAPLAAGRQRPYDCEGLAQDEQGRLYLCDEAERWVLRCDPAASRVERLRIDWTPVTNYFGPDLNASFEGIAVGDGRLYLANERSAPVIIAVDLETLRVVDHFVVIPRKGSLFGTHYSDLAWWDHRLFVLCRQHAVVLEVEPRSHTVLAEFDYSAIERELGYGPLPSFGLMEGLAVDPDWFWLVIDNNGLARRGPAHDARPVLLQCPRPDRRPSARGGRETRPGFASPAPPVTLGR